MPVRDREANFSERSLFKSIGMIIVPRVSADAGFCRLKVVTIGSVRTIARDAIGGSARIELA